MEGLRQHHAGKQRANDVFEQSAATSGEAIDVTNSITSLKKRARSRPIGLQPNPKPTFGFTNGFELSKSEQRLEKRKLAASRHGGQQAGPMYTPRAFQPSHEEVAKRIRPGVNPNQPIELDDSDDDPIATVEGDRVETVDTWQHSVHTTPSSVPTTPSKLKLKNIKEDGLQVDGILGGFADNLSIPDFRPKSDTEGSAGPTRPRPKRRIPVPKPSLEIPEFPIPLQRAPRLAGYSQVAINSRINMEDRDASDDEMSDENYNRQPRVQLTGKGADSCLHRFLDPKNICQFCQSPMPKNPTKTLKDMTQRLYRMQQPLKWQQTIEHCQRHRAETDVFPLGLQACYPERLNFHKVAQRIAEDAFVKPLMKLMDDPCSSPFFAICKGEIAAQGLQSWSALNPDRIARLQPGYFGELGRKAILTAIMKFTHSGKILPSPDRLQPLNQQIWVDNVFVIEVAVLLIQQDIAHPGQPFGDRELALRILRESRDYGRLRFGTGSEFADEKKKD